MKTPEDAKDAEGNVAVVVWIYIVDCRFLIVDLDPRCGIQQSTIKNQQFGVLGYRAKAPQRRILDAVIIRR